MTCRAALHACVLTALLMFAPAAAAQTVELTPFGGLAFGGELIATPGLEEVPLQAGPVYGGAVNVAFLPKWRFEALVMRQQSQVRGPEPGTYVRVNVDRFLAGVQEQEPLSASTDIFGEIMAGATRYAPAGYESELWFTLGIAAGVKIHAARHIGFRLEGRAYYTPVVISGVVYCGGYGCLVGYNGTGTFQGEVTAGVIIGF
jgi:hypothetical protein